MGSLRFTHILYISNVNIFTPELSLYGQYLRPMCRICDKTGDKTCEKETARIFFHTISAHTSNSLLNVIHNGPYTYVPIYLSYYFFRLRNHSSPHVYVIFITLYLRTHNWLCSIPQLLYHSSYLWPLKTDKTEQISHRHIFSAVCNKAYKRKKH